MIPQAAPARRIARSRPEVDAVIASVLDSDTYNQGTAVASFEQAFAARARVSHCVGVAFGTDALALALRALDIGLGDEVITTALTSAGTAQAILHCGARPLWWRSRVAPAPPGKPLAGGRGHAPYGADGLPWSSRPITTQPMLGKPSRAC